MNIEIYQSIFDNEGTLTTGNGERGEAFESEDFKRRNQPVKRNSAFGGLCFPRTDYGRNRVELHHLLFSPFCSFLPGRVTVQESI